MLSTSEILDELEHLSYKPGWTFLVYDGIWEGQHFVIRTEVPDSYSPGKTVTLDVHSMLPPCADIAAFHRWLAWRLGRIETHEMREFLRRDGQPLFDPHAPGAEHDDHQPRKEALMTETGYILIPIVNGTDIPDTRAEAEYGAKRAGGTLIGEPEVIQPDEFDTKGLPEAARIGLPIVRWTMTRQVVDA